MHQESGGHASSVSSKGAMGLMQLMPFTYDLMREQYKLGDDPYDPHNSILAGTGYIRQMYDIYGSPGFLAAYDAGPGRLDDYLTRNRPLPAETRNYVAMIGPKLAFDSPRHRSQTDIMTMNHASPDYQMTRDQREPDDPALTHSVQLAWAHRGERAGTEENEEVAEAASPITRNSVLATSVRDTWAQRGVAAPVQVAETFTPAWTITHARPHPLQVAAPTQLATQLVNTRIVSRPSAELAESVAEAPDTIPSHSMGHIRFRFVNSSMVATLPWRASSSRRAMISGKWAIQVGAFGSAGTANEAAGSARAHVGRLLDHANAEIASVQERHGKLFRARLTGLSRAAAEQACEHMPQGACIVVSPAGQT